MCSKYPYWYIVYVFGKKDICQCFNNKHDETSKSKRLDLISLFASLNHQPKKSVRVPLFMAYSLQLQYKLIQTTRPRVTEPISWAKSQHIFISNYYNICNVYNKSARVFEQWGGYVTSRQVKISLLTAIANIF